MFIGRKVTVYFRVGCLTLAGSIYGLTPPIAGYPHGETGESVLILCGFGGKPSHDRDAAEPGVFEAPRHVSSHHFFGHPSTATTGAGGTGAFGSIVSSLVLAMRLTLGSPSRNSSGGIRSSNVSVP